MTTGEQVRAARVAMRMTMAQLAAAVGVTTPFVCEIEHDNKEIPVARRQQFADVLGLDIVMLEAAAGYTRELADWIKDNPELIRLLRESRSTGRPLRIGEK